MRYSAFVSSFCQPLIIIYPVQATKCVGRVLAVSIFTRDKLQSYVVEFSLVVPVERGKMFADETDIIWEVGYVSGAFDLFHVGHLNLLRRARERCNRLIVGVLSDESIERCKRKSPVIPLDDRIKIVEAIRYVDEVDVTTIELLDKIKAWEKYRFDAMFSGDDHTWDSWTKEENSLAERGAVLVFFPYTQGISTSSLRANLVASGNV